LRPPGNPASSTASSARPTARGSRRSHNGTGWPFRSCGRSSSRRRRHPTSSGSRMRSASSASITTCSRSCVRRIRSAVPTSCAAAWRPWIFLTATADDGAVGWAEITDSHGSPRGLAGIVEDLAPHVVGRDPRAVERIVWDLFRATRQSPGSVIQKAIGGVENALLDLKAKALGIPVYELFGGPTRGTVEAYWSHCGTTRARAWEATNTPTLAS